MFWFNAFQALSSPNLQISFFLPWISPFFYFSPHRNLAILSISAWYSHSALYQLFTKPHRKPFPLSFHPSPKALVQNHGQLNAMPDTALLLQNRRQSIHFPSHCKYFGGTPSLDSRLASYLSLDHSEVNYVRQGFHCLHSFSTRGKSGLFKFKDSSVIFVWCYR